MSAVAEVRASLYQLADKIRADIEGRSNACAREREWAGLSLHTRMAVMLLAGVDGDLAMLARLAWGEFAPGEKLAVQSAIRTLSADLHKAYALRLRAG